MGLKLILIKGLNKVKINCQKILRLVLQNKKLQDLWFAGKLFIGFMLSIFNREFSRAHYYDILRPLVNQVCVEILLMIWDTTHVYIT